jgi:transposase-like protein
MMVRDISAQLADRYGTEIGRDTISTSPTRPRRRRAVAHPALDEVDPIVYLSTLSVKVGEDRSLRNLACYLALGVNCVGEREVPGIC